MLYDLLSADNKGQQVTEKIYEIQGKFSKHVLLVYWPINTDQQSVQPIIIAGTYEDKSTGKYNLLDERRNAMGKSAFLLVFFLLTASCASTSNLGIITKSVADPASLLTSSRSFEEIGIVRGKACRFFLVGIIPWGDSTVTRAIDKALESGGDALINVSVTSSLYGFVPIYNILCFTCTEVEGIAIEFVD